MRYHYDVPVEFYRLWLDSRLIYSCGYFHRPEDDLEAAQTQKLEYLCRKLRLAAGDRVLDIGCGWGGFALHAAAEHGAIVHGVTLSRRQADVANERVAALGLARRCRIEARDYRDVRGEALYDKIVSVGMVEHVGRSRLAEYCRRARQLLVSGGVFLIQGIGTRDGRPNLGPFADRYVFPDAELAPVRDVVGAAEAAGSCAGLRAAPCRECAAPIREIGRRPGRDGWAFRTESAGQGSLRGPPSRSRRQARPASCRPAR